MSRCLVHPGHQDSSRGHIMRKYCTYGLSYVPSELLVMDNGVAIVGAGGTGGSGCEGDKWE